MAQKRAPQDRALGGFVALDDGTTAPLLRGGRQAYVQRSDERPLESGDAAIYTESEMPSLESLLRSYKVLFAVIERPAPEVHSEPDRHSTPEGTLAWWRVVLAIGLAVAITTTGAVLLVADATSAPLRANPYVAAFLLLGGFGLIGTVAVSLRGSGRVVA